MADSPQNIGDGDDDNTGEVKTPPTTDGSGSISGHAPDPDSDDDILEEVHKVGLYEDADEENPKELNIAKEINQDEEDVAEIAPPDSEPPGLEE